MGRRYGEPRPPHKGKCTPLIPHSDRRKFKDAADKLGKGVVVVGAGVAIGGILDETLPYLIIIFAW
jgi:hypothetical protein